MRKLILYMVAVIILVNIASSIGISPAKSTFDLDYDHNIGEAKIRVLNNEHKEMRVLIQAQGHLAEYVKFSKTDFLIGPEQSEDYVEYSVNMSDVPLADMRSTKISIYVIEMPAELSFSGSGASTGTAAIHKLIVSFPFESPAVKEKVAGQTPVSTSEGSSAESSDSGYVPLKDQEVPIEQSETSELNPKKSVNTFVYIVIALIALNLLWLVVLFRKKTGKKKL